MRVPPRLIPLVEAGHVQAVLGQLMSGKEADVYLVEADGETCCAKVYKEAEKRNFRQQSTYREGRSGRDRDARAMKKGSKFGRDQRESSWRNAEVDALFRLHSAGVRVPKPYISLEGVLLMERVTDQDGDTAPRLRDFELDAQSARETYAVLAREAVKMLCAGIIHGDYSEFNVLMAADGPVIIDLPQAVEAMTNNNARDLFKRDLDHLRDLCAVHAPELAKLRHADEIWHLFSHGKLHPDSELKGAPIPTQGSADATETLALIADARAEAEAREVGKVAAAPTMRFGRRR